MRGMQDYIKWGGAKGYLFCNQLGKIERLSIHINNLHVNHN